VRDVAILYKGLPHIVIDAFSSYPLSTDHDIVVINIACVSFALW